MFVLHVLPGDLEAGLIRFGARIYEIGVIAPAHQCVDLLGQTGGGQVHRGVREIRQLPHLLRRDLGEFGAAVADVDAPQSSHGVEIGRAVGVINRRALAAGDNQLFGLQLLVLNDGVQDVS